MIANEEMLYEDINSKKDDIRKSNTMSSTSIEAKSGNNLRNGGGEDNLHNTGIVLVSIPK